MSKIEFLNGLKVTGNLISGNQNKVFGTNNIASGSNTLAGGHGFYYYAVNPDEKILWLSKTAPESKKYTKYITINWDYENEQGAYSDSYINLNGSCDYSDYLFTREDKQPIKITTYDKIHLSVNASDSTAVCVIFDSYTRKIMHKVRLLGEGSSTCYIDGILPKGTFELTTVIADDPVLSAEYMPGSQDPFWSDGTRIVHMSYFDWSYYYYEANIEIRTDLPSSSTEYFEKGYGWYSTYQVYVCGTKTVITNAYEGTNCIKVEELPPIDALTSPFTDYKVYAASAITAASYDQEYVASLTENAIATGSETRAIGSNSFAGGTGTIALEDNQVAIGKYNTLSQDALFVIGNGDSEQNRSNAFEIKKNGTLLTNGRKVLTEYSKYTFTTHAGKEEENLESYEPFITPIGINAAEIRLTKPWLLGIKRGEPGYDGENYFNIEHMDSLFDTMTQDLLDATYATFEATAGGCSLKCAIVNKLFASAEKVHQSESGTALSLAESLDNVVLEAVEYHYSDADYQHSIWLCPPKAVVDEVYLIAGEAGLGDYDMLPFDITIRIYK